jgi:hypothetical protein
MSASFPLMWGNPTSTASFRRRQMKCLCTIVVAGILALATLGANAENVVVHWNNIASNAIVKEGNVGSAPSGIYFAYVHIAEYDAVNAISQRFQPMYYRAKGPRGASQEAAVAAAAHGMLVHLFPAQQSALDAEYNTSLAGITDGSSKKAGIAAGEAAAAAEIAARQGDGFNLDVAYEPKTSPGDWQCLRPRLGWQR